MAEFFSREKLIKHRRKKVDEKSCLTFSCVTPAGTSTSLTSRINGKKTHTQTRTALSATKRTNYASISFDYVL